MKVFVLVSVILISCITCSSSGKDETAVPDDDSWYVTVSGKVANPSPGQIVISELTESGGTGWMDTIRLKNDNTFSKEIKVSQPGYYKMNFFNVQVLNVILYKSDVQINVDGSSMNGPLEINGSPDLDLIDKVTNILQGVQSSPEAQELGEQFQAARNAGNQEKMMELQQAYQELTFKKQEEAAELIRNEPPSLAVINLLQNNVLDRDRFFDTYVAVADKLKKEWSEYSHAKKFIEMVDAMRATAIGQQAPEIALPNPDGEIVKLSSMQGKYVLVDFWAKWCGPCRAENPNVVRVFNKYKDQGFTVFGVSLDRSREDWLRAIEEDGLTWTHVSDLKYWQSEAAKTYNINAIPFSLLLDPNGVIIDKNLRGAALEKKLAEIFEKK